MTLVLERGNTLIGSGLLLFRKTSSKARLYSLSISPTERGKGLADQLLQALETEAAARACTAITLEVREGNTSAIHVYERVGYIVKRRLPGYYPDGETALKMEKALPLKDHIE